MQGILDSLNENSGVIDSTENLPRNEGGHQNISACDSKELQDLPSKNKKGIGINPMFRKDDGSLSQYPPLLLKTELFLKSSASSHSLNPSHENPRNNKPIQLGVINFMPGIKMSHCDQMSASMNSLLELENRSNVARRFGQVPKLLDSQSTHSDPGTPAYDCISRFDLQNNQTSSIDSISCNDKSCNSDPQPTDPEFKKEFFIKTLFENLSIMYAIFLFMIGCVLYLSDTLSEKDQALGEAFNVGLIIIKLLWLAFIHWDVLRYLKSVASNFKKCNSNFLKESSANKNITNDDQQQLDIYIAAEDRPFQQNYGFTSGRHGGSLYVKIGAIVFCIGYLIHTGLSLAEKIIQYSSDDPDCNCLQDVLQSALQPIYAFYQLFFIFRYSNLIINVRKKLSRFALMHCISSSLLLWVYTIIQETLQEIHHHKTKHHGMIQNDGEINDSLTMISDVMRPNDDQEPEYAVIMKIVSFSPYLYPFSIEYNILIVGFWILLRQNIGRMDRQTHVPSVKLTKANNIKGVTPTVGIYLDCNNSFRGLFAGLLLTVASAISIILLYIFSANEDTKDVGLQVTFYSELIFLNIMSAAAVWTLIVIRQLDISKHATNNIDDLLLYICLPCIFLYSVFSLIPAITEGKPYFVAVSIVQIVQVVIQTALISDGLRRRSNTQNLAFKKPGRELLTFLIIANLSFWLLETFQVKLEDDKNFKFKFYGKATWTLLSHITLPVALFYRFHSSVCLVDIWKGGYEIDHQD